MQTVGQFHQHHAHVVNHRQQHLAHIFRLLLFARDIADVGNLGQAFDQMRNFFAKVVANGLGVGQRVFDHVMQQAGGNRNRVQPHVGENVGDFQRMHQVRFARGALLALVFARRKKIGAPQQIQIGLRMIAPDFLADFFDSNHKKNGL